MKLEVINKLEPTLDRSLETELDYLKSVFENQRHFSKNSLNALIEILCSIETSPKKILTELIDSYGLPSIRSLNNGIKIPTPEYIVLLSQRLALAYIVSNNTAPCALYQFCQDDEKSEDFH